VRAHHHRLVLDTHTYVLDTHARACLTRTRVLDTPTAVLDTKVRVLDSVRHIHESIGHTPTSRSRSRCARTTTAWCSDTHARALGRKKYVRLDLRKEKRNTEGLKRLVERRRQLVGLRQ
jgi:hypothetical protein